MEMLPVYIVLGVVALVLIWIIAIYNGLVAKRQTVNEAFSGIDVQLKLRRELIPNLVETVKGFARQESTVLTQVTEARAKATSIQVNASDLSDPAKVKAFQDAQGQLSGSLGRLLASVEAYPELKSNQNFLALQSQLEGTENRINVSIKDYVTPQQLADMAHPRRRQRHRREHLCAGGAGALRQAGAYQKGQHQRIARFIVQRW